MRKLILFTMLFVSLISMAQVKRNSLGQKMVDKVLVYSGEKDTPYLIINFEYDNDRKLIGVVEKSEYQTNIWKKVGNTMKRTKYLDGKIDSNYKFEHTLNRDGLISEMTMYNGTGGEYLVYKYQFFYTDGKLDLVRENHYIDYPNGKRVELSDRYKRDYLLENGNVYFSPHKIAWRWKEEEEPYREVKKNNMSYYEDKINDTNIDFLQLFDGIKGTYGFELATEWINLRSKNLIQKNGNSIFDYLWEDYGEDTNIIEFHEYDNWNKKLRTRFEFFYLLE